jgi:hypothetical protein
MKTANPLVTFLIPSRKRLGPLTSSIKSLEQTCNNIDSFEVIVIFDEDDTSTINEFKLCDFKCSIKTIVSKRYGYYGLHNYINNAFEKSSGEWFWLWNDDIAMVSKNWDLVIHGYRDQFVILNPANSNPAWANYVKDATISPLVPKKWFQLLNRFSAYSQYDTYINSIAYRLNMVINENRLVNDHRQLKDEVSSGISYEHSKFPKYESDYDYEILKECIGNRQLLINWFLRTPYRSMKYLRRRKKHFKRMFNSDYLKSKLSKLIGMTKIK